MSGRICPRVVGSVVPKVPHEQNETTPREDGCHRPKQERQPSFQERGEMDAMAYRRRTRHPDCGCLSFWLPDPHVLGPIGIVCDRWASASNSL